MKKQSYTLKEYSNIATIHSRRLESNIKKIQSFYPHSALEFEKLNDDQIAYLDAITTRFIKLQDVIGAHIFPRLLSLLEEDAETFIDKLNKLEKLNYLPRAQWWISLRHLRNNFTHEYPDDYETLFTNFKQLMREAPNLITYWNTLHTNIQSLSL